MRGRRERPKFVADNAARASADALIDFVKDECRRVIRNGEYRFHREHQARRFAARRDFCQRLERFAGIWRHHKLNLVDAGCIDGDVATIDRHAIRVVCLLNRHAEFRFRHSQVLQLRFDLAREAFAGVVPRLRQRARQSADFFEQL